MRTIIGYFLAAIGYLFAEMAHQIAYGSMWCLDLQYLGCPECDRIRSKK